MRPPRESLLLLGLMTAACLTAGLVFGIATGQFVSPPQATATHTVAPAPTTQPSADVTVSVTPGIQITLLLLGVTDAYAPTTNLEACWVISFRTGVPEYYVTAFPPSAIFTVPGLDGPRTLSQIHAEDVRLQLDHKFVRDAVQTRFPGFILQSEVVLDRSDLAALISQLGGVNINNQMLTGPMLLATYDSWPAASDLDRLQYQGDILQRLFSLLAERQWTAADLVDFVAQLPRINADPATVSELQSLVQGAPPVAGASLIWRPYGPELEAAGLPPTTP
jgi:hypothetical protein